MKCLVLCYDRDINFVDLLISSWNINMPNNPFIFYVPYNDIYPEWLKQKWKNKIILIKSKKEILITIKTLLSYTKKNEWVLWNKCEDYIEYIDKKFIKSIIEYTKNCDENIMSIKFSNKMKHYSYNKYINLISINDRYSIDGNLFLKINTEFSQWRPAFVKADYIHKLFKNLPEPKNLAKELDFTLEKYNKEFFDLPKEYIFLIPDKIDTIIAEATSRGLITKNAINYMKKNNIKIPKEREIDNSDLDRFKFDSLNLSYTELLRNKVQNINNLLKS